MQQREDVVKHDLQGDVFLGRRSDFVSLSTMFSGLICKLAVAVSQPSRIINFWHLNVDDKGSTRYKTKAALFVKMPSSDASRLTSTDQHALLLAMTPNNQRQPAAVDTRHSLYGDLVRMKSII